MGERVTELRKRAGMRPVELARALGIKQPSLWAIEHGRTKTLSGNTLARMCEELRTTADFLLHGSSAGTGIDLAVMEAELTYTIRALDPARRVALIEYARYLMAQQPDSRPRPATGDSGANIKPIRRKPQ